MEGEGLEGMMDYFIYFAVFSRLYKRKLFSFLFLLFEFTSLNAQREKRNGRTSHQKPLHLNR